MISAGVDGFIKSGYRKFNIRFEEEGKDDTAMMKEVMRRRFSKLKQDEYPDLIIIDGGKGQINAVAEIFLDLKVNIPFIGMSKGENRNAGEEFFHQINKDSFTLPKDSPLMYYLQRLRDEAHRFAIMTHRKRRSKDMIKT
jgi:excinuclease ABC subunit C